MRSFKIEFLFLNIVDFMKTAGFVDKLIDWFLLFILFENTSPIWEHHHCWWKLGSKIQANMLSQCLWPMSREGSLLCHSCNYTVPRFTQNKLAWYNKFQCKPAVFVGGIFYLITCTCARLQIAFYKNSHENTACMNLLNINRNTI